VRVERWDVLGAHYVSTGGLCDVKGFNERWHNCADELTLPLCVKDASHAKEVAENKVKMREEKDVVYPTVIAVDVSVKLPERVSNILISGFRIIERAPVAVARNIRSCSCNRSCSLSRD